MGRLLTFDELNEKKGLQWSRSHLWRLERAGKFPRRLQVGENAIAWDEEEIDKHIEKMKAARDAPPSKPVGHRRVRRRVLKIA